MKALISFIRKSKFLKNISIVQKNEGSMNVNFIDRNELISYLNSIPRQLNVDTVLFVKCACDRDFIFAENTDIPNGNIICECGQMVIEYS
jgi:hypothetical protein